MNAQYMCFSKLTMAQERLRDIESEQYFTFKSNNA